MRFSELRRALLQVVVAGLPALGCTDEPCVRHYQKTFMIAQPAEAQLQFLVDNCRVDIDACPSLCSSVLQRSGTYARPARVAAARAHAAADLVASADFAMESLVSLGLPYGAQARGLVSRTNDVLWGSKIGGRTCRI